MIRFEDVEKTDSLSLQGRGGVELVEERSRSQRRCRGSVVEERSREAAWRVRGRGAVKVAEAARRVRGRGRVEVSPRHRGGSMVEVAEARKG